MDKKSRLLTLATVLAIISIASISAAYWIYSNTVTVTAYYLQLTPTLNGVNSDNSLNVTLTAQLSSPSLTGSIEFLNVTNTTPVSLGSNSTTSGVAIWYMTFVRSGTVYQARYYKSP